MEVARTIERHLGIELDGLFSRVEGDDEISINSGAAKHLASLLSETTVAELLLLVDARSAPTTDAGASATDEHHLSPHLYDLESNYNGQWLGIGMPPPRVGASTRHILSVLTYTHSVSTMDPLITALVRLSGREEFSFLTLLQALGFHWELSDLIERRIVVLHDPRRDPARPLADLGTQDLNVNELIESRAHEPAFLDDVHRCLPAFISDSSFRASLSGRGIRSSDLATWRIALKRIHHMQRNDFLFGNDHLRSLQRDLERLYLEYTKVEARDAWLPSVDHAGALELLSKWGESGDDDNRLEEGARLSNEIMEAALPVRSTVQVSSPDLVSIRLNDEVFAQWRIRLNQYLAQVSLAESQADVVAAKSELADFVVTLRSRTSGSVWGETLTSLSVVAASGLTGAAITGSAEGLAAGLGSGAVGLALNSLLERHRERDVRAAESAAIRHCMVYLSQ